MKRNRFSIEVVSALPVLLGVLAVISSAAYELVTSGNILAEESFLRIKNLLSNPVRLGVGVVYISFVLAILSFGMLMLIRAAEARRSTQENEGGSSVETNEDPSEDMSAPPTLSPAEKAARDRERNETRIRVAFGRTRRRLTAEIEQIQKDSLVNLMFGIVFSAFALGILGYPIFAVPNDTPITSWLDLIARFAPRFSVAILVQLIGFFFLRLYVAGAREVHYIRNEITNWEARTIAYLAALSAGVPVAMRDNINQLVRTERNFRLKRGERSLYETDETYNDVRQFLADLARSGSLGERKQSKKDA